MGTAAGDFTSNGEPDLAVVTSSTLKIELNNGSGGFTAGDSYTIPSGYEAKGVVVGNFTGHDNSDARHRRAPGLDQHRRLFRRRLHGRRRRHLRHAGDLGAPATATRPAPSPTRSSPATSTAAARPTSLSPPTTASST